MIVVIPFIIGVALFYIWKTKYEDDMEMDPTIIRLKSKLLPYFPKLQNIKVMKSNSSYTINKHKIYICTEHNGIKYDDNMLTYVLLHELAHVETKEIGHGKSFLKNFSNLLNYAQSLGIWDPNKPRVANYCKTV